MSDETIDRQTAEQTTKNIKLAGRFLREVLANPDLLAQVPQDASVVILPSDDPELAEYNRSLAARLIERGEDVIMIRLGELASDDPACHKRGTQ